MRCAAKQSLRKRQQGLSIIIVIFLLVAISVLVASIAQLSGTSHVSVASSHRSMQAYFAAHAGLGYAMARINGGFGCAIDSPLTIQGYTVTLTCNVIGAYDEGNPAAPYNAYSLAAIASNGSFAVPDVFNRSVRATIKFP